MIWSHGYLGWNIGSTRDRGFSIKKTLESEERCLPKLPKTRNDFKPESQLNKIIAGMGIRVLDSIKVEDRPKDWKERWKRFPTNQNNSDVNFSHNAANSNETNDPRNNETGKESSEKTNDSNEKLMMQMRKLTTQVR